MNENKLAKIYSGVGGLDRWAADCGLSNEEAIKALDVSERTWYRWKVKGLPPGWMHRWIIDRMIRIKRQKNRRRAGLTQAA